MKERLKQHRETILYLFFGALTTAVSMGLYYVSETVLDLTPTVSNLISWIGSVIFAFVTNKIFVFESKSWKPKVALKEGGTFFASRILSGILEILLFEGLIRIGLNQTVLGSEGLIAKGIVTVVVIIINYILSKLIVFRKK